MKITVSEIKLVRLYRQMQFGQKECLMRTAVLFANALKEEKIHRNNLVEKMSGDFVVEVENNRKTLSFRGVNTMRILIWGFGNYYKRKEQSITKNSIIAFVSSREKGRHEGIEVIEPKEILEYEFDRLYIMTSPRFVFEILDTLKVIGYQDWEKVILGCTIEPYTEEESLLFNNGKILCDSKGVCVYESQNQRIILNNIQEWGKLKQYKTREEKKNIISEIPCEPISKIFGIDRGLPVDRYYIEKFLKENSFHIKGDVMEVAERVYTVKYGTGIKNSHILHVNDSIESDCIIADLETGEGVIGGILDCFILTQTLPFIFDVKIAAQNVVKFLKPGGVALVTVPGITQISRYDMERWGHYWSFTTASLQKLFEMCEDVEYVKVKAYGNVKSAASGLYGLAVEDMVEEELIYQDDNYQQIITAVIKKREDILL